MSILSSRLSRSVLIELCRALRHYLGAGLTLEAAFRQQAARGPAALRPVAGRIADMLKRGSSLEDALDREQRYFPPLFVSMARVGEQSGMLPEVFEELEGYFVRVQQMRRMFLGLVAWPVFQFFAAVFVLAGVIFILGILAPDAKMPNGEPYDPLGLGLHGTSGALTFLGIVFGTLAGLAFLGWLAPRVFKGAVISRILLAIPALGPCLRDLALGRFCMALRLTMETAMSITRALRLALAATGNAAFAAASPVVEQTVKQGDDLTLALTRTRLFPADFLRILSVAETSGRLNDVLQHQDEHYHESARRRMVFLTTLLGIGLWVFIGICLIVVIFRFFIYVYLPLIDPKTYGI
jgi:type IV pilus assembly protein PilC